MISAQHVLAQVDKAVTLGLLLGLPSGVSGKHGPFCRKSCEVNGKALLD